MNEPTESVEQEIQRKGLTAPRVTPSRIAEVIASEYYHRPPGSTLTLCVLTLANGFTVTGESACASPENFDEALGQRLARENAVGKVWALEGYALRERLSIEPKTAKARAELERDQLHGRLNALYSFQGTEKYHALSADTRALLASQATYMSGYLQTLEQRLIAWTD